MSSLVQRHPLACFFVLTYLAAWCLWAPLVLLRGTLPPAVAFILVMLGGWMPSTVAIVLVAIIHGKRGVRRLLGRLVKWRVGLRWYAVVLILPLLVPLGLGLSILLGGPAPTVDSSIIAVLVGFVFSIFPGSAVGEELGWRGFTLPHLQDSRSALAAALILGPIWGSWHFPLFMIGSESRPLILSRLLYFRPSPYRCCLPGSTTAPEEACSWWFCSTPLPTCPSPFCSDPSQSTLSSRTGSSPPC